MVEHENGDMPEVRDVPESFLERIRQHPSIGIGIAVAVLVISLLLSYYVPRMGGESEDMPTGDKIENPVTAEETSGPSAETTSATETTGGETDAPADMPTDTPVGSVDWPKKLPAKAALVAYRLGGGLWVVREDGTKPVRVAELAPEGEFALSPDGKTLAWIDAPARMLHLADVASAKDKIVGAAESVRISWAPDSSWLAYTVETPKRAEVHRVLRDGTGEATLGVGHSPAISPDGKSVAYVADESLLHAGDVAVAKIGGATVTVKGAGATEVAWGADGLIYAVPGSGTACELRTSARDGSGMRLLVGASKQPRPVMYGSVHVSLDGRMLAYSASGDDGFSRTYTLALGSVSPIALTVRRDTYPLGWSADSSYIFFVEGNAFQGEPSNVLRAAPDGLGRVDIVPGGAL